MQMRKLEAVTPLWSTITWSTEDPHKTGQGSARKGVLAGNDNP